jgi:hypothetical protein
MGHLWHEIRAATGPVVSSEAMYNFKSATPRALVQDRSICSALMLENTIFLSFPCTFSRFLTNTGSATSAPKNGSISVSPLSFTISAMDDTCTSVITGMHKKFTSMPPFLTSCQSGCNETPLQWKQSRADAPYRKAGRIFDGSRCAMDRSA